MDIKQTELDFLQYKTLVASIHDVVFKTDAAGNWTFLNDSWSRIMQYGIEESISKPFYSFLHPDDVEKNVMLFEPMIAGKKQYCSHEIRYITKSNKISWMKVFSMLVKNETGMIIGTQGTLQDINIDVQNREMRKKAEIQIAVAMEKERELNRLKSNFVSLASHEFRTPLAIMRSSIELSEIHISKNGLVEPYLLKHIQTITSEIDRLGELIEKVLTLGRIDSKAFTCKKEKVDLVSLVKSVIHDLEKIQKDDRTMGFIVKGIPRIVMVDPLLLAQSITNIVSNAFKYSVDKPLPILELIFKEADYSIVITDFGIGIPPNAQDKVSQAFYRADNVSEIKGTGLGIFIANKFILMHKGTLNFTSIPQKGTVFTIRMN